MEKKEDYDIFSFGEGETMKSIPKSPSAQLSIDVEESDWETFESLSRRTHKRKGKRQESIANIGSTKRKEGIHDFFSYTHAIAIVC